jgi:ureidoglycolate hydrolase
MDTLEIKTQFLDEKTFLPYGEVIGFKKSDPEITNDDFSFWPGLSDIELGGDIAQISLLEIKRKRPLVCDSFERHLSCSEAHFLLQGKFIILAALPCDINDDDAGVDIKSIKAFLLDGTRAINIKKRVWHWMPYPVTQKVIDAVIFEKLTYIKDIQVCNLNERHSIRIKINPQEVRHGDK